MAPDTIFTDILNMSALGDKLRETREEKNLTLGQAQKQTRIHQTVLKALEEGKCDSILNPTYEKSFLKKYAEYLGIDSRQVLKEYKRLRPDVEPRIGNRLLEPEANSSNLPGFMPLIKVITIGIVALVLITLAGGKVISYLKRPHPSKRDIVSKDKRPSPRAKIAKKVLQSGAVPKVAAAPKAVAVPKVVVVPKVIVVPTAAAAPKTVAVPKVATVPTTGAEKVIPDNVQLKLLLKVNRNVLIKMRTDGVLLFERVLAKGSAETFTADKMINIFAANGESIELVVNGKSMGSPGKGVLRNIEITKAGIKLR